MLAMSERMAEKRARSWIPVYATIVIAAKIAITTITIKSSTIVKPDLVDALKCLPISGISIKDMRSDVELG